MSWDEQQLTIVGPAGQLEILVSRQIESSCNRIGIICHPHPLYGGTMHNKVVTTLARTFKDLEIPSIRFNYRGVGKSEGTYADGHGETEDTLAVIHWALQYWPQHHIWLAGFSFGSFVALNTANHLIQQRFTHLQQLITIAPAVNHADFSVLSPPPCPWIVVQGGNDEIVPAEEVITWTKTLQPTPELLLLPSASHFFDGQLIMLRQELLEKLKHAHTS